MHSIFSEAYSGDYKRSVAGAMTPAIPLELCGAFVLTFLFHFSFVLDANRFLL